jgi:tetratricopeptide (TPR) repeat protein
VLAILAALASGCRGDVTSPSARAETTGYLNMDPNVGYVGMDACRTCHFEQYETFTETGMGRAFYPMSPEIAVEDFTVANEIVVEPAGLRYRMEQRDGRFFQRQFFRDSAGREIASDEHELLWVVGSNNHSRSYLIEIADKLFQAPVCWYPQASKWELCPGYEFQNENFTREINPACINCHNGRMELVEGERNRFHEPYPHGIDCERCHGPGQLHVERWSAERGTEHESPDRTIVNPRRLPPAERIEVCFQCHLGDARATERVPRHDRDFADWRPGQRLTSVFVAYRYVDRTEWDFGLSSQGDRLMMSRCFQASGGKIECLTCHDPHVSIYSESRPADYFTRRCLGCHASEDCSGPAPARQATDPADNCVACHMRSAEPGDQRFTTFTDHWIRRRIDLKQRDERESFAVEPVFPAELAQLSRGERDYYQARALYLLERDVPERRRPALWAEAETLFRSAIDHGYDTANAWYFLGKTQGFLGRGKEADQAFHQAYERDPQHYDAAYAAGQSLVAQGRLEEGLAVFERILAGDPHHALALAEAGRTLAAMRRPDAALEMFHRAVAREPWSPGLRLNRARLLASMDRLEEAAAEGAWAARLDPDDPEVWEFWVRVMEAAGRPEASAEGRSILDRLRGRSTVAEARQLVEPLMNPAALAEDRVHAMP